MRRFIVIAIPIVTLVFFVLLMLSGDVLKQSFGRDDDIPQSIEAIIQDINNENWEAANRNTDNLATAWNKVVKRVQFSSERNEIDAFSTNVARLRGSIKAKDKSNVLVELSEAYEHWNNLGK